MIDRLPDATSDAVAVLRGSSFDHPVLGKLTDLIARHGADIAKQWGLGPGADLEPEPSASAPQP